METAKDTKQPAGFGPGKALRQARLDLRLSPEDVATQLHLAARQILALEEDDFSALPQSTYVRGYLRSYALLLGLSPEPILEAYGRMHVAPKPAIGRDRAPHGDHQQNQVRVATYVVGALVLVLVLAWWQGADKDELTPPPSSVAPSTTPPLAYAPTAPTAAGTPTTTPPSEASNTTPVSPAPPNPETPVAPAPNEVPRIAKPEATPPPKTIDRSVRAAPIDPSLPRARLVFNAEQESWVDVRDARDSRLLYETVPAGRIVAVEGVPPFNVFLGNVDGIVVYVDGKVYDARKYKRGSTARFSVGGGVATAAGTSTSSKPSAPKPRPIRPPVQPPAQAPATDSSVANPPSPMPAPTTPAPAPSAESSAPQSTSNPETPTPTPAPPAQ